MIRRMIFFISFILMIPSILLSSMFVNDSTDCVIISGMYDTENDPSGSTSQFVIGGEYVFYGNFSLGASFTSGSYKDDSDSYYNQSISGYGLDMSYHYKNDPMYPVNFSFSAGYASIELDADYLDDLGWEATGNAISFGVQAYKAIIERETFELIPFAGLSLLNTHVEIKDSYGDSIEDDDQSSIFSFGLGIKAGNAFVKPSISMNDGDNNFNITFGMILPQPKR